MAKKSTQIKIRSISILEIVSRLFVGVIGGYVLCSGLTALVSVSLPLIGLTISDAVIVGFSLAFPIYVGLQIWSFSDPSLVRLYGVVFGTSAAFIGGAVFIRDGWGLL